MEGYTPLLKENLRAAGCYFERPGKGDHEIWFSPITGIRFVVDGSIKSRHTSKRCPQASRFTEAFLRSGESGVRSEALGDGDDGQASTPFTFHLSPFTLFQQGTWHEAQAK